MSIIHLNCFVFIWIILGVACAGEAFPSEKQESLSAKEGASSARSFQEDRGSQPECLHTDEPFEAVNIGQALALSIMKNPELAAYSWEVRAAEARVIQANLLPNPEFGFEAEELGWSDGRNGIGSAVMYFTLSQLVELGDKRGKRTFVAALESHMEDWEYASCRLDLLAQTTRSFIYALAAQKRVALSEKFHRLADQVFQVVSERVAAGKVSPLEKTKARVSVASSRIELERARRQWDAARKRLAANWGSLSPVFEKLDGDLDVLTPLPTLDELLERTALNPNQARWETEIQLNRARLEFEKSKRVPNLTVTAGLQRFEETDENAFVFGLTVPIPVFDRNQGGIEAARDQLRKAEEGKRAAHIRIKTDLNGAYQVLSAAHVEAVTLKKEVLPAAREVFDGLSLGYQQGKFHYLDVLDAQRTLFEAQAKYIDALADYHMALVEVERLVGQGMDAAERGTGEKEEIHETE